MAFDLSNYEDVNARITRFRAEFPMGRLEAHIDHIDFDNGRILVRALAFRTDDPNELPAAIDYAHEHRATVGVNRDFWVENAITSAYGRAIGALSPSGSRPTRQDMEKAEKLEAQAVDHYQPKNVRSAAESISDFKAGIRCEADVRAAKVRAWASPEANGNFREDWQALPGLGLHRKGQS
jgi:hypothetical protein